MGIEVTSEQLAALDASLNTETSPLAERFRSLFTLKNIASKEAVAIIAKGLKTDSALLGHELAYCLGQIKDQSAIPTLNAVLEDEEEHPMVRHEAAEALGAISSLDSIPILTKYLTHSNVSIRETCEIALAKIKFDNSPAGLEQAAAQANGAYSTIDPAPASSSPLTFAESSLSVTELQETLMNPSLPLFERYRAMFALRNLGTREAVLALATGFDDSSALFRHEIAYVFGQLSSPHSVPSLVEVLRRDKEEDMVRHEAAEALGGIATDDCLPVLREFATKDGVPKVVRESCEVALDMWAYENSNDLQYTTPLATAA